MKSLAMVSEWGVWSWLKRYAQFCLVGGSGVVVDMGIIWLLASPSTLAWDLTVSKVIATELVSIQASHWPLLDCAATTRFRPFLGPQCLPTVAPRLPLKLMIDPSEPLVRERVVNTLKDFAGSQRMYYGRLHGKLAGQTPVNGGHPWVLVFQNARPGAMDEQHPAATPRASNRRIAEPTASAMKSRLNSIQDGQWAALAMEAKCQPESLAAICGVSLRHLERFFNNQFGKAPSVWLLELRLRHARDLLRQGYSTKAIAQELSFTGPAHFCHAFKKAHGLPPQTFRLLEPPDVARR